jgi:hypothetical protein
VRAQIDLDKSNNAAARLLGQENDVWQLLREAAGEQRSQFVCVLIHASLWPEAMKHLCHFGNVL